jgi:hypothetical protein
VNFAVAFSLGVQPLVLLQPAKEMVQRQNADFQNADRQNVDFQIAGLGKTSTS